VLRIIEPLGHYEIVAAREVIGMVEDFYFDVEQWTLRYFVVDTGTWVPGHKLLVSPIAVHHVNWPKREITVNLTNGQIRMCPSLDPVGPVTRQYEIAFNAHYGYTPYWPGPGIWAGSAYPASLAVAGKPPRPVPIASNNPESSHLRSANEVRSYHVHARDRDIGQVEEFLLDDETWTIKYLIVDTSDWLGGRLVLVPQTWIERIVWSFGKLDVRATSQNIRQSPTLERERLSAVRQGRALAVSPR
jgi:hypothetical protein